MTAARHKMIEIHCPNWWVPKQLKSRKLRNERQARTNQKLKLDRVRCKLPDLHSPLFMEKMTQLDKEWLNLCHLTPIHRKIRFYRYRQEASSQKHQLLIIVWPSQIDTETTHKTATTNNTSFKTHSPSKFKFKLKCFVDKTESPMNLEN